LAQETDRYEPLPGIAALPGWLWRRTGRRLRIALGVGLAALVALAVALVPGTLESKQERAESERRARAERRERLIDRLEAEQRPRLRRSDSVAPAGAGPKQQLTARAGLMDELARQIRDDARRRVRAGELDGPIRRVACEPFPRSVVGSGADQDLSRRRGRYSCVAVTAEFERSESTLAGIIGHQYRALVDFQSGRYAYCKIAGQAGPTRDPLVTTPRACGGR
jgi:hypothetical protein